MTKSFGQLILQARQEKGYSQRDLAILVGLDFTYLSKLENDHADYAPKENAIRKLAEHLELDAEKLIFLAGRIPLCYVPLLKAHYKKMPVLFCQMRKNPKFAQRIFNQLTLEEIQ